MSLLIDFRALLCFLMFTFESVKKKLKLVKDQKKKKSILNIQGGFIFVTEVIEDVVIKNVNIFKRNKAPRILNPKIIPQLPYYAKNDQGH